MLTKQAADVVVAANLLQIEALAPHLEATHARLAIKEVDARNEAYELYADELPGQLGRCFERVVHAQDALVEQAFPQGAADLGRVCLGRPEIQWPDGHGSPPSHAGHVCPTRTRLQSAHMSC